MPRKPLSGHRNRRSGFSTAFRPGIRISVQGVSERISLPLEIVIEDNGPGVPPDLLPILFDPFVTTKANGSGLGLALVAKIVGDHGGVVDMRQPSGPHPIPHPAAGRQPARR